MTGRRSFLKRVSGAIAALVVAPPPIARAKPLPWSSREELEQNRAQYVVLRRPCAHSSVQHGTRCVIAFPLAERPTVIEWDAHHRRWRMIV
jgi:hypothetical protein